MTLAQDIIHDMKEKKLWIPALLIVATTVAVPMQLSKGGDSTVVASAPAPTTSDTSGPELSLTRASTTGFARAPRVNTKEVDPFGSTKSQYAAYKKSLVASLDDTISSGDDVTSGGTSTGGGGGDVTGGGGGGGDVTPTDNNTPSPGTSTPSVPKTTPPTTESDTVISVVVTQDDDAEPKELTDVRTLSPLPDAENPFLVYVAATDDKEAQFIVASNAVASGDGVCAPSPTDCSTLTLAVGQTEKFVVTTVDNTVTPAVTTTANISVTLTDLAKKKVVVEDGTDDTAAAARYELRARAIGAKALKAALVDPKIGKILMKNHVLIR